MHGENIIEWCKSFYFLRLGSFTVRCSKNQRLLFSCSFGGSAGVQGLPHSVCAFNTAVT